MKRIVMVLTTLVGISFVALVADHALAWRAQRDFLLSASSSQHRMALPARIKISIYGDSIIQGFPIHALLPQGGVIENRGMVGDSVEHIEARFQQSQSESDLVILEGGINNIVRGEARHETDHDIIPPIVATERRMVAEAKRRNSKVMIVTVHPVTKRSLLHHFHSPFSFSVLPSHFDVARVNTLVLNLNKALTEMAWQEKIDLVDIHKALVASDGEIERTYVTPDGLHLSVFGYGVFAKTLAPFLKLASSGPSTERDLKDGGEH